MKDILEKLLTGQLGSLIVVAGIFAAIVILLRFLYGPKGLFRDPRWDEGNRRIRMKESEEREFRVQRAAESAEGVRDGK